MSPDGPDECSRRMAGDDPLGWFERLYSQVEGGTAVAPWDRGAPHPLLVEWAEARALDGTGRRALVVGAGLGADAEYVAGLGFATVAFDLAETAVRIARRRFPESPVEYRADDLLEPPAEWHGAFDLVIESLTVQSMPPSLHADAIARIAAMVGPGGTLLVVATGRGEADVGGRAAVAADPRGDRGVRNRRPGGGADRGPARLGDPALARGVPPSRLTACMINLSVYQPTR